MSSISRRLVAVVAPLCVLMSACSDTEEPGPSSATTPQASSPQTSESSDGSSSEDAQTSGEAPTSTAPDLTPVDPLDYMLESGNKFVFSVPGDAGSCFLTTGLPDADGSVEASSPYLSCELQIDPTAPDVTDRTLGTTGHPSKAVISGDGAYPSPIAIGHGIGSLELPIGSSITVSHMYCEVPEAASLHCLAQTGEFVYEGGQLSIVRDEPSPYPAAGAGKVCGEMTGKDGTQYPVIIAAGKLDCEAAEAVMSTYFSMPEDPNAGNTQVMEVDGFTCYAPTAASAQESGVGADCTSDGSRVIVPLV